MNKRTDISYSFRALISLWTRELRRFVRQRSRLFGALAQPLFFWLLLGAGFGKSFRLPSAPDSIGYMEFLFPGMLILTLLFTAIFATISIIEDRNEGFLQSVLVAPIPRIVIVLGNVFGATTLAVSQAILFLFLAPTIGLILTFSSVLVTIGLLITISLALSSLGFLIAWRMESTQGFHAIMNLLLIPLWLLSGAFFPVEGAPRWFGFAMRANPLTYSTSALRHSLYIDSAPPGNEPASFGVSVLVTILFATVMLGIAAMSVKSKSKID